MKDRKEEHHQPAHNRHESRITVAELMMVLPFPSSFGHFSSVKRREVTNRWIHLQLCFILDEEETGMELWIQKRLVVSQVMEMGTDVCLVPHPSWAHETPLQGLGHETKRYVSSKALDRCFRRLQAELTFLLPFVSTRSRETEKEERKCQPDVVNGWTGERSLPRSGAC